MSNVSCSQCELGVSEVVIAIGVSAGPDEQNHVTIVYRDRNTLKALHLAWNRLLLSNDLQTGYLISIPAIDPRRARSIASRVRIAAEVNERNQIPYGFGSPNEKFSNVTMKYAGSDRHYGLTCATFAYSLLCAAGWKILDYSTWSEREGDAKWRDKILGWLEDGIPNTRIGPVSKPDFFKASSMDVAIRIRPEDLAAAIEATNGLVPATFEQVQSVTSATLEKITTCSIS